MLILSFVSGFAACYRQTPHASAIPAYAPPRVEHTRLAGHGAVPRDQARPTRAVCCSSGWAISSSCFSRTPSPRQQALDIALTKRGRHDGADIPMCGVPVHTAEAYLARLIRAGFKVAICDQIEDPAEARRRGAKMLAARGGPRRHRRHARPRRVCSTRAGTIILPAWPRPAARWVSPGSIYRPAPFLWRRPANPPSPATSLAFRPARSCCPSGC